MSAIVLEGVTHIYDTPQHIYTVDARSAPLRGRECACAPRGCAAHRCARCAKQHIYVFSFLGGALQSLPLTYSMGCDPAAVHVQALYLPLLLLMMMLHVEEGAD